MRRAGDGPRTRTGIRSRRPNWFTGAGATTKNWGNVVALSYSHAVATFSGKLMPYWADASTVSLKAFKDLGLSSYFS